MVSGDGPPLPTAVGINQAAAMPRLLLLLAAGAQLYAIDSEQVVEVIPRVMLRPVSGSPRIGPGCSTSAAGWCRCWMCHS